MEQRKEEERVMFGARGDRAKSRHYQGPENVGTLSPARQLMVRKQTPAGPQGASRLKNRATDVPRLTQTSACQHGLIPVNSETPRSFAMCTITIATSITNFESLISPCTSCFTQMSHLLCQKSLPQREREEKLLCVHLTENPERPKGTESYSTCCRLWPVASISLGAIGFLSTRWCPNMRC